MKRFTLKRLFLLTALVGFAFACFNHLYVNITWNVPTIYGTTGQVIWPREISFRWLGREKNHPVFSFGQYDWDESVRPARTKAWSIAVWKLDYDSRDGWGWLDSHWLPNKGPNASAQETYE